MKNRFIRGLSFLLAILICASLAACGNDETTAETADATATAPITEGADIQNPVVSGVYLAAVEVNGKWGYIDETGKFIIEPRFDYADTFNQNGVALATFEDQIHYIDTTGKILTNKEYGPYSISSRKDHTFDGLIMVRHREDLLYGFMDFQGNFVIPAEYSSVEPLYSGATIFRAWKNGKGGILELTGKFTEVDIYLGPYFQSDFPGYITVIDKAGYSDYNGGINPPIKYAYMDKTGKLITEPIYDEAYHFTENSLARVRLDGLYGYIDTTGNLTIPTQFYGARDFSENGLAAVKVNEKWGFIDSACVLKVAPAFDSVGEFDNGMAPVLVDGKWGSIDEAGNLVIEPQFDSDFSFNDTDLATVKRNGKYGVIDKTGKTVIPADYDDIYTSDTNYIRVKANNKWGLVSNTGSIITDTVFDSIWTFSKDGIALVEYNDKLGYIDTLGNFIMEPQFDSVTVYDENGNYNTISVTVEEPKTETKIEIDSNGRPVRPNRDENSTTSIVPTEPVVTTDPENPDLSMDTPGSERGEFTEGHTDTIYFDSKGLTLVTIGETMYFVDKTGKKLNETGFSDAYPFFEGIALVKVDEKWGCIDSTGTFIVEPQFACAGDFSENGLAPVISNHKWGYIDTSGKFVIDPQYDDVTQFIPAPRTIRKRHADLPIKSICKKPPEFQAVF